MLSSLGDIYQVELIDICVLLQHTYAGYQQEFSVACSRSSELLEQEMRRHDPLLPKKSIDSPTDISKVQDIPKRKRSIFNCSVLLEGVGITSRSGGHDRGRCSEETEKTVQWKANGAKKPRSGCDAWSLMLYCRYETRIAYWISYINICSLAPNLAS
jgi:hypothetical protein